VEATTRPTASDVACRFLSLLAVPHGKARVFEEEETEEKEE